MSGTLPVQIEGVGAAAGPKSSAAYIVTLVHGTFARDAPWLERGSNLRRTIAKELGAPVRFLVFRWSGANNHQTRTTAGADLQTRLRKTLARYPDSKHFIVAHSHGGNIAMRALDDNHIREQVMGVVTMGTPFLASKARRADLALMMLRFTVPIGFFLVGMIILLFLLETDVKGSVPGLIMLGCQIIASFFVKRIFRYVKGPFREKVLERQLLVNRGFQRGQGFHVPLLCGVATADEARGLLTSMRNLSNAWFFLFRLLASPFRLLWIFCLVMFWLLVLSSATDSPAVDQVAGVIAAGMGIAFMTALLMGPLMLFIPKIVRAHRLGFGGESVIDNALNDVSISTTPLGMECDLYEVGFAWKLRPGLPHGSYYRDAGFLTAAGKWMRWVGEGGRGVKPSDVTSKARDKNATQRYTIAKKPLRIAVVCFTGLMALAGYLALTQDSPPQFVARVRFPALGWWLSPVERNLDLQPGVTRWPLKSVVFWSRTDGVAVGGSGTVVRTMDGGKTWKAEPSIGVSTLSGLASVGDGKMWLRSNRGPVFQLDMAGDVQGGMATKAVPNDISFPNERCGWAVTDKGGIAHTCDAGATWTEQQSGVDADLVRIHFLDERIGWATGKGGQVLHTVDGGASWIKQASGVQVSLRGMAFVSATRGWLVGDEGTIVSTTDGGSTWRKQNSGGGDLRAIAFRNDLVGVAVGEHGTVLSTQDSGVTWNKLWLSNAESLADVTFAPDGEAWAVGDRGTILRADKDGLGWRVVVTDAEQNYNALAVISPTEAWIAGDSGVLLHTVNSGSTWSRTEVAHTVDPFHLAREPLHGLAFSTQQSGWAVGDFGRIAHTDDGGKSWRSQDAPTLHVLHDVVFPSSTEGWAVGGKGTMLHTQDSGKTWTVQPTGSQSDLLSLYAVSNMSLWACGEGGTVLHTDDGGKHWHAQETNTDGRLNAVAFTSPVQGTVVGDYGVMRHTDDGGQTWKDTWSKGEGRPGLNSIAILSKDNVWAVGPPAVLYRDLDGNGEFGFYRDNEFKKMKEPLQAIRFADRSNGWIVGLQGGIFHTADGASSWEQQGYTKLPAPWLYPVVALLAAMLGMVLWRFRVPEPATGISSL